MRKQKHGSKGRKKKIKKKEHINMADITVEEMKENVTNILNGVKAQSGFRKTYTAEVVNRLVTDTAQAAAVIAELDAGYDAADAKFDTAAQAEAAEQDEAVADDENLISDLFKP